MESSNKTLAVAPSDRLSLLNDESDGSTTDVEARESDSWSHTSSSVHVR